MDQCVEDAPGFDRLTQQSWCTTAAVDFCWAGHVTLSSSNLGPVANRILVSVHALSVDDLGGRKQREEQDTLGR